MRNKPVIRFFKIYYPEQKIDATQGNYTWNYYFLNYHFVLDTKQGSDFWPGFFQAAWPCKFFQ